MHFPSIVSKLSFYFRGEVLLGSLNALSQWQPYRRMRWSRIRTYNRRWICTYFTTYNIKACLFTKLAEKKSIIQFNYYSTNRSTQREHFSIVCFSLFSVRYESICWFFRPSKTLSRFLCLEMNVIDRILDNIVQSVNVRLKVTKY